MLQIRQMGPYALVLALSCAALPLLAQDYPSKPVRVIIPFAAGGSSDTVGRLIAQKLTASMGQTFVIENRSGAGGNIGADLVAKSRPDGYTLLFPSGSFTVNVSLYEKLPYDPLKDFEPIIHVCMVNGILVAHPAVKATTVQELIDLARAQPSVINFGSAGNGTMPHLAGEMFKEAAKVNITHVPYKGSGPALADLLGGQVQLMFANMPGTLQHVKSGRLRVLAQTGDKRSSALPEVPTIAEAGLTGYRAATYFGALAPAGTPRDIILKLNAEFAKALSSPDLLEHLRMEGADIVAGTPEQFRDFLKTEVERWPSIIRAAGIKPN